MFVALAVIAGVRYQGGRAPVEEIYTPSFFHVAPTPSAESLRALDTRLHDKSGPVLLRQLLPDEAGILWISLLVLLVAGFDCARPWSARNLTLLGAQAIGWSLIGSIDLFVAASRLRDDSRFGLIRLAFAVAVGLTAILLVRLCWQSRRPDTWTWTPTLDVRALAGVAAVTMAMALAMPFLHPADDSSYFTDLGGQRLMERGRLPYGDPMLTKTPGAAYGPLMYPCRPACSSSSRNRSTRRRPTCRGSAPTQSIWRRPRCPRNILALFQILAAYALFAIGRRWAGERPGVRLRRAVMPDRPRF